MILVLVTRFWSFSMRNEIIFHSDAVMGISFLLTRMRCPCLSKVSVSPSFDRHGHRILVNNKEIPITASEWKIISFLIENDQNLVTRTRIMEECFNYHYDSYDRLVDTHVKNIRMKLGEAEWIETVRGYGYKFIGERK